jgi:membrane dipeptidase
MLSGGPVRYRLLGRRPLREESETRFWHKEIKNAPWMLKGSMEKSIAAGAADQPHMFNVDSAGKHNPAAIEVQLGERRDGHGIDR